MQPGSGFLRRCDGGNEELPTPSCSLSLEQRSCLSLLNATLGILLEDQRNRDRKIQSGFSVYLGSCRKFQTALDREWLTPYGRRGRAKRLIICSRGMVPNGMPGHNRALPMPQLNLFLEHGSFLLGGRILREHGGAGGTKPRTLTPAVLPAS